VKLRRIEFRNFRSFENFDLDLDEGSFFLIGENGGGKSSLLTGVARALGRDLNFSRADFADPAQPIELRVVVDDLNAAQQGTFAGFASFRGGLPTLTLEARSTWDATAQEADTEHRYPTHAGQRSRKVERDAIPLLWMSASRDARRLLDLGNPNNLMGRLIEALPIQTGLDQAVADIQAAGARLAADASLAQLLTDGRSRLDSLVPDVAAAAFTLGVNATTPRELLRQLDLIVEHLGEPISVDRQSSGIAQLAVFVFAIMLAERDPGLILLVDEPEISLHPQAQRSLVTRLTSLQSQTLIATHSPSLLERADPRRVMRLRRQAGGANVARTIGLNDADAKRLARHTTPHAADAFFARTVILVEGLSDLLVIKTLAGRQGRDLDAEGVSIVPLGGARLFEIYLHLFGARGLDLRVAGLVDNAEERYVVAALAADGHPATLTRQDRERLGFFVCVDDLEGELVRALGAPATQHVIANQGDAAGFRTFQNQPQNRALPFEDQLRAFLKNRKVEYAPPLADAVQIASIPGPLAGLLRHV
jgi:predicted ATPase